MMQPLIKYFARMELSKAGGKTPKFTITAAAGHYSPMEKLKGRDGKISFYLVEKLKEGLQVPSVRLQAKASLNFTGLKDYFIDGKISGFAFGYPPVGETYSKAERPNPFHCNEQDAFLFIVYSSEGEVLPHMIEMLVLEGAKSLAGSYCKQLQMGGFDEELKSLRIQAKTTLD